jgi:hypothetical protein
MRILNQHYRFLFAGNPLQKRYKRKKQHQLGALNSTLTLATMLNGIQLFPQVISIF